MGGEQHQKDGIHLQGDDLHQAFLTPPGDVVPPLGVVHPFDELQMSCGDKSQYEEESRVVGVAYHQDERDSPHWPASWRQTPPPILAFAWGRRKVVGHQAFGRHSRPPPRGALEALEAPGGHSQDHPALTFRDGEGTKKEGPGVGDKPTWAMGYDCHGPGGHQDEGCWWA